MVESNTHQVTIRSDHLPKNISLPNLPHLKAAMLLGTPNCNFLGQRLNTHLRDQIAENELIVNASMKSSPTSTPMPHQMLAALNHTKIESPEPDAVDKNIQRKDDIKMRNFHTASTFTIDSILAPKPIDTKMDYNIKGDSCSPSNSPSLSSTSSPIRPARVPAMLHPGLQLSHLAAAAATGFGTPSDFFGNVVNHLRSFVFLFF